MYSQTSQGERVSAKACATCHNKKIRCDKQSGVNSCSACCAMNVPCRPHERKRKRDQTDPSKASPVVGGDAPLKDNPFWSSTSGQQPPADVPQSENKRQQGDRSPAPGSYLGRAEYISGVVPIDEEDARMYLPESQPNIPDADMQYLRNIGAFDLPARPICSSLIEGYFERCAPWMPIVDKIELDGPKASMLLLQAIFVAGSRTSTAPQVQAAGRDFYRRAKALFNMEIEKAPLNVIRAICIVQWWNPSGPEHVSMNASSFWLHMGVALAHQIGLHREPNAKQSDTSLRRRLWWVLFIRDCMISLSHGRPRSICMEDCNVRRPTLADFPEANQDARLFIAYVEISSILADLTEASVRGTLGRSRTLSIETRLSDWIKDLPSDLRLYNQQTGKLALYQFKARQLHVPYFTALMILYRPVVAGGIPSTAAVLASSFVVGIYDEFLARGEVAMLASTFIFHLLASAVAQLTCYRYPALWETAEPELDIIAHALIELTKRFPTGLGAQRVIKHVTQAIKKESQLGGPPLLRGIPEHLEFFSSFGPELCSKWDFVYGHRAEAGRDRELLNEIPMQSNPLPQPTNGSQSPLPVGHLEVRPEILVEPYNNPGPAEIAPPWMSYSNQLSNLDGMMPSAFDDDAQRGLAGSTMGSVGNWMLSDWLTDMN